MLRLSRLIRSTGSVRNLLITSTAGSSQQSLLQFDHIEHTCTVSRCFSAFTGIRRPRNDEGVEDGSGSVPPWKRDKQQSSYRIQNHRSSEHRRHDDSTAQPWRRKEHPSALNKPPESSEDELWQANSTHSLRQEQQRRDVSRQLSQPHPQRSHHRPPQTDRIPPAPGTTHPQQPYQPLPDPSVLIEKTHHVPVEKQKLLRVALVGYPNAGKSTLVNQLIGRKVTAVSSKRNTTEDTTLGSFTLGDTQVVLIDTPGIVTRADYNTQQFRIRSKIAWDTAMSADLVVLIVDADKQHAYPEPQVYALAEAITSKNRPVEFINAKPQHVDSMEEVRGMQASGEAAPPAVLVLNKTDLLPGDKAKGIVEFMGARFARYGFLRTYAMSAMRCRGVQQLKELLLARARPQPWQFPPEVITEKSVADMALEVVREQIYRRYNKELPYLLQPQLLFCKQMHDGVLRIHQVITVDKSTTKAIVVGRKGEALQRYVVDRATERLQLLTGKVVKLSVSVEVVAKRRSGSEGVGRAAEVDEAAMAPIVKSPQRAAAAAAAAEGERVERLASELLDRSG